MANQAQNNDNNQTSRVIKCVDKPKEASPIACGACKYMRRKCNKECIFAPYFASDHTSARFEVVHKVFGRSNLSKMLTQVDEVRRCEVMDSLCYEAQARLADPVYGCLSTIVALQQQVSSLQGELAQVQNELINTKLLYASLLQSTQQQQQPNIDVVVESEYPNNAPASTNLTSMSFLNPDVGNLATQTTPPTHSLEPFQFSGFPQHDEESWKPQDFNNDIGHLFP